MRFFTGLLLMAAYALCQTVSPFTAVEVSRQYDAAGKLTAESRFLFAMNRDGSIASVELDPGAAHIRQIIDVVKHRTIVVDSASRSAIGLGYRASPRQPVDACESRFNSIVDATVGVDRLAGTVNGIAVERVSVHLPDRSVMQAFLAPSLGCHMLRTVIERDGLALETHISERLLLGDPDPRMFEVPADYHLTVASLTPRVQFHH